MKKKILYVEDEPFLGKIVKETIEGKDFEMKPKDYIVPGYDNTCLVTIRSGRG